MPEADCPYLADLKAAIAALGVEAQELIALRIELARRELAEDLRTTRRLAVSATIAGAMLLTAVPLAATALAWQLAGCCRISLAGWLVIEAALLAVGGGVLGYLAWGRFRRDFRALAESREELREDLVWLREHLKP